ncbi:MAG: IclR family transcriptional regulator [Amphiplicatus sp.]
MQETRGSTEKALDLLQEVIALGGEPFVPEIQSQKLGFPVPSLYRYLNVFLECGVLIRPRRGEYLLHPVFLASMEAYSAQGVLERVARSELEELSARLPATLHFGVLETDMVTYLVKVAGSGEELFTQERQQLEAYCSGIGKVLLAAQPEDVLTAYLSAGAFPALTPHTITDPAKIRLEIAATRARGYGVDGHEVHEDLVCIAAPVVSSKGVTLGAISAASKSIDLLGEERAATLALIKKSAARMGAIF